jgi:hypothetical protein
MFLRRVIGNRSWINRTKGHDLGGRVSNYPRCREKQTLHQRKTLATPKQRKEKRCLFFYKCINVKSSFALNLF